VGEASSRISSSEINREKSANPNHASLLRVMADFLQLLQPDLPFFGACTFGPSPRPSSGRMTKRLLE
jgi:hypothetical protein